MQNDYYDSQRQEIAAGPDAVVEVVTIIEAGALENTRLGHPSEAEMPLLKDGEQFEVSASAVEPVWRTSVQVAGMSTR